MTGLELLFDVVFVLALAQLSTLLEEDTSWTGAVQTLILLLPLSVVWAVTAEECDKYDPQQLPIQLLVLGALLGTLVMAAAAPEAFGERGLYFAGAYLAIQLGASGILVHLLRGGEMQRSEAREAFWFGVSAVPWIVGAIMHGWARAVLWALALAVEYLAAVLRLPTPGLGRGRATEFGYSGEHLADRCRQFFTIALGELILVTGLTLDQSGFRVATFAAVLAAFATTVLLWRVYFYSAGEQQSKALAEASGPVHGRPVVFAHPILVAAVIAISISYKFVISHPLGRTPPAWVALIVGGPALFLAGRGFLEYAVFRRVSWDRPIAILVLVVISPAMILVPPVGAASAAALVLAGVALVDTARGPRRGQPAGAG
ncbi:low temperature requirement protein A [Micromonospora coriariae]|uniref:low temperature requirement protein A n=1 Tax=Micromonospora coriariae TaxID=285665 RepID=UPI0012FDAB07|nr:low temperature requirement protein A [Micromonospora coriariae]